MISNSFSDPNVNPYGISNYILTTLSTDHGDSGGIVFASINGAIHIVGIIKGKYTDGIYVGDTAVCKGWEIMQALGLQIWD